MITPSFCSQFGLPLVHQVCKLAGFRLLWSCGLCAKTGAGSHVENPFFLLLHRRLRGSPRALNQQFPMVPVGQTKLNCKKMALNGVGSEGFIESG